jgi:hypothetical protein
LLANFLPPPYGKGTTVPEPENVKEQAKRINDFVTAELAAVLKSSERHPHNYYAFQYARRLFRHVLVAAVQATGSSIPRPEYPGCTQAQPSHITSLTTASLKIVRNWCYRHPSDASGWSFLDFLVHLLPPMSSAFAIGTDSESVAALLVERVVEYLIKFRMSNEAAWVFSRGMLVEMVVWDVVVKRVLRKMREVGVGGGEEGSDGNGDGKEGEEEEEEGEWKFERRVAGTVEWVEKRLTENGGVR